MRVVGALCAVASASLFGRLVAPAYPYGGRAGAPAFAVAAVGDVWLGRLAFALGVTLGLAAALAYARRHRGLAALLCALCAAASPVAGLALGIAAVTVALARREPWALLSLAAPGAAIVLAMALFFPEGGSEPFPLVSFAVLRRCCSRSCGRCRRGSGCCESARSSTWPRACCSCCCDTPVGSNVERYGVLLAGAAAAVRAARARRARRGLCSPASACRERWPSCAIGAWVLWGPVRETKAVARQPGDERRLLRTGARLPRGSRRAGRCGSRCR